MRGSEPMHLVPSLALFFLGGGRSRSLCTYKQLGITASCEAPSFTHCMYFIFPECSEKAQAIP